MSLANRRGAGAFFLHELRRGLPIVGVGWAFWLLLFLYHRVDRRHWGFWDGSWSLESAAGALMVLTPMVLAALMLTTWAAERGAGSLRWLYMRPLSTAWMTGTRLVAAVTLGASFAGGLFVLHASAPVAVLERASAPGSALAQLVRLVMPLWGVTIGDGGGLWPLWLWLSACVISLAVAFWAAAVADDIVRALLLWILGVFLWLGLFHATLLMVVGLAHLQSWDAGFVARICGLHALVWALAWGSGAMRALRRSPVDGRLWIRTLWPVLVLGALSLGILLVLCAHPVRFGEARTLVSRQVGETHLQLVRSGALNERLAGARWSDDKTLLPMLVSRWDDSLWPAKKEGASIFRGTVPGQKESYWLLRPGEEAERLSFPGLDSESALPLALGWSPEHRKFAWLEASLDRIQIFELGGETRAVPLPAKGGELAWIGEDRLFFYGQSRDSAHWWVLEPNGQIQGQGTMEPGTDLQVLPGVIFEGAPTLLIAQWEKSEILSLRPEPWRLESRYRMDGLYGIGRSLLGDGSEENREAWLQMIQFSMDPQWESSWGVAESGTLVWWQPGRPGISGAAERPGIWALRSEAGQAEQVCLAAWRLGLGWSFVGSQGQRAVWMEKWGASRHWGYQALVCDLRTGEARLHSWLDGENPQAYREQASRELPLEVVETGLRTASRIIPWQGGIPVEDEGLEPSDKAGDDVEDLSG